MTEKEKMLSGGFLYLSDDPELRRDRARTRALVFAYNHTLFAADTAKQADMLRAIFPRCPADAYIEPPLSVDYGYNVFLGSHFYANYQCVFIDSGKIRIGDHVKLGPCVNVYTAEHPVDPVDRLRGYETVADVVIGNNVWIGGGSVILPGAQIGDGCVIGGGSVVKGTIPAYSVAVGNPCKAIGRVTDWPQKQEVEPF